MKTTLRRFLFTAFAGLSLFAIPATSAVTPAGQKTVAKAAPSDDAIADARGKGLVWVNLSTHVYHKSSSSMYGKTKRGKFMTEDDAKKAGYRLATEPGSSKKASASASSK